MESSYKMSRVVVYDSMNGVRKQTRCCLRVMHVLDQDFKTYLENNEGLMQEFRRIVSGQGDSVTNDYARMMIEFAFVNRARFAIEQKLELTNCAQSITSESAKLAALAKIDLELDYAHGLLEKLGSKSDLASTLTKSVKEVRRYRLEELANVEEVVEVDNEDMSDFDRNPVFVEDDESSG